MAFTKVTAAGINTGGSFVLENINTSGIITATTVNVGSAVTISSSGANVTGIVTAGTVQVGSATTIHTTGIDLGGGTLTSHNINSTGVITSTSFVGNVTGNVTGNLTGNVTGNVSSSGANTLGSLTVTNDATVGGALTVTGDFTVNGTTTTIDTIVTAVDSLAVDGNVTAGGNLDITGVSTFKGTTEVKDSSFKVTNSNASGQYLQVTQNTNSSLNLDKVGDGAFYIRGNNIYLQNDGTSETYAGFEADGKSYLNYDGNTKLETTGTGVTITGDARVTGILTVGTASVTIDGSQDFPTIRPTLDLNFAATKTLDRRITFTRDSIGTYTDELGIIQTVPNNVPRFDHDPATGESLGLLIEESRTNLVTHSEDFSNNAWTENGASESLASSVTAPDGTTGSVYQLIENSSTSGHFMYDSVSVSSSATYTWSVWMKANTRTYGYMTEGNTQSATAWFNLSNGTLISVSGTGSPSATAQKYPNGWVRCTMTFTTGASQTSANVQFGPHDDGSGFSYAGNGSSGIYVWGAQAEAGSFATSYIPTSGSTVTRAADIAKITGTNFTDFYNQTESTIFVHYKLDKDNYLETPAGVDVVSFRASGNTHGYDIRVVTDTSTPVLDVHGVSNSVTQYDVSGLNLSSGFEDYLVAKAFKLNDMAVSFNGGALQTDSSLIVYEWDKLVIGLVPRRAHYKSVKYYNKRLTNSQLQSLTRQ